jgi:ATP-binding cassette subfamily C (CFTR/MRP) protein 1
MVFDDVFSALDKITKQHVFTNVFGSGGLLRQSSTTIILVSQSSLALRHANHIIVLDSRGHLAHQGSWETLRKVSGHVQLLADVAHQDDDTVRSKGADNLAFKPNAQGLREPQSIAIRTPNKEIVAEHRGKGDLGLYKTYAKAVGKRLTTWILLLFAVSAFSTNFSSRRPEPPSIGLRN